MALKTVLIGGKEYRLSEEREERRKKVEQGVLQKRVRVKRDWPYMRASNRLEDMQNRKGSRWRVR